MYLCGGERWRGGSAPISLYDGIISNIIIILYTRRYNKIYYFLSSRCSGGLFRTPRARKTKKNHWGCPFIMKISLRSFRGPHAERDQTECGGRHLLPRVYQNRRHRRVRYPYIILPNLIVSETFPRRFPRTV